MKTLIVTLVALALVSTGALAATAKLSDKPTESLASRGDNDSGHNGVNWSCAIVHQQPTADNPNCQQ